MSAETQFCRGCRNILHPEEDKSAKLLMMVCRTCSEVSYADRDDAAQYCVDSVHFNYRSAEDVKSYLVPGLQKDPTLPRAPDWPCSRCGQKGAVFFQLPERVLDDAMTLVYACTHCPYYEVKGKIADEDDTFEEDVAS